MALISIIRGCELQQQKGGTEHKLTESNVSRMIPAHGKIPHHTPQVLNSNIPPSPSRFALVVQTPYLLHLTPKIFPKDLPEPVSVIAKPGSKDNEVRVERAIVFEPQPGPGELLDERVVLEPDLPVNDHLAGSDVCKNGQDQERFEVVLKWADQSSTPHPDDMRAMGIPLHPGRSST